jgi:hypothetical protein
MRSAQKIMICILICFTLLHLFPSSNVNALALGSEFLPDNGCNPMDVVFIMGAPVSHIEWVFDALAIQHLTRCTASDQVSQIGVVTTVPPKGPKDSYVVVPLTPLSPSTISIWNEQREALFSQLESATYVDDPRNIRAGFEAAFDLVMNNTNVDPDRKTVFIYIGYPVTALGSDIATVYLSTLHSDIEARTKNMPEGALKIWAILTEDHGSSVKSSNRDMEYLLQSTKESSTGKRQGWDLITSQYGGKYFPGSNKFYTHDWQISNAIFEALRETSGLKAEVFNCGAYTISPYQGSMEIFFLADSDDIQVQLEHEDLDGNILQMTGKKGDIDELGVIFPSAEWKKNNVLLLSDPMPGTWRVNVLGGKCDAMAGYRIYGFPQVKAFSPQEKLSQYDVNGEKFDPENPHHLTVTLQNPITGMPMVLWKDYPPQVKGELVRSDGVRESLGFDIAKDHILQSEPLNVIKDGLYQWNLDLSLPVLNDRGDLKYQEVFPDIQGEYNVQEVREIRFEILLPQQNETIQLHANIIPGFLEVLPVKPQMRLKDKAGNSLKPDDVFKDPAKAISASLIHRESNEVIISDVYFTVSEDDATLLVGEFGGGGFQAKSGEYMIIAKLSGEINRDKYRAVVIEERQVFERKDGFLSWPPLWLGLFGLICLAILVFMAYQLSLFLHPLTGEIQFRRVDSERPFFILKLGGKRVMRLTRKKLIRKSPILNSVNEISISHASKRFGKGIELRVDLFDGSTKRKELLSGDILVISKIIEAVYVDQKTPVIMVQDEMGIKTPSEEDMTDE